ncbi:ATP-dependent DNA helicase [Algibacter luteus]|uniref:ATP-dependent DNA helicase n=1 Tax=Algibacter luteus TaxID=1178825 RepID=UPI00259396D8|nr:AAA family ATPase [Algibacter luteus]WJJ96347.1 AAA family ATPase [Algibacter luteus]
MDVLKKIERRWLKNFQESPLVLNNEFQPKVASQLFYGFGDQSEHNIEFELGFNEFYNDFDYSNPYAQLSELLKYLNFIGITIKSENVVKSMSDGTSDWTTFTKKVFYLLKQLARYDKTLDIRNPYFDNLGDLYFFMRIEGTGSEVNQQLSLFEEVQLPDFYNKYIELPENYSNDEIAIQLFEEIENNNNSYFITGKAGTGKSTFIHYFTKNTTKDTLLFAFTGIAAINIGGQTLHSFFGFPFKPLLPEDEDIRRYNPNFQKYKILQKTKTIIVDEVSMLRSDLLEGLDFSLRINGGDPHKRFGGKQMIFVGDAFQLPPIVDRKDPIQERVFNHIYNSEYFFDSPSFLDLKPRLFEFEKVHRQSELKFVEHLNKLRNYSFSESDIQFFNQRYAPSYTPNMNDFVMMLTSNNYIANDENQRRLAHLPYASEFFKANINGEFKEDKYPTLPILELKRGAQIMFVKNDSYEMGRRWVNGTIGKVNFIKDKSIEVELANGETYEVGMETWENRKYQWDRFKGAITSKVVGTFTQLPIKLAWAITIHKSQGLSFDKVHIDLGKGAFVNGQLYTALSRCRNFNGLTLKRQITKSDIIVDSRLVEFNKAVENGELVSSRNFLHSKEDIEDIMSSIKSELLNINYQNTDYNDKLIKLRLNTKLDFGIYEGETLEQILKHSPDYILELLKLEYIVIAPSTIEIIEKKYINFDISPEKIEEMKLKNERYNEE